MIFEIPLGIYLTEEQLKEWETISSRKHTQQELWAFAAKMAKTHNIIGTCGIQHDGGFFTMQLDRPISKYNWDTFDMGYDWVNRSFMAPPPKPEKNSDSKK